MCVALNAITIIALAIIAPQRPEVSMGSMVN